MLRLFKVKGRIVFTYEIMLVISTQVRIIYLHKESHHTVRNKGDIDSFLNMPIPDGIKTFFITLTISKSV